MFKKSTNGLILYIEKYLFVVAFNLSYLAPAAILPVSISSATIKERKALLHTLHAILNLGVWSVIIVWEKI